jgi:biopolymer transport protein ExbB/TolQ
MNQDMNMGMMMVCMVAGVLFSLAILAFVVIQTASQARILKEVRRIAQKSGRLQGRKSADQA